MTQRAKAISPHPPVAERRSKNIISAVMRLLLRLLGLVIFVLRRQRHHLSLTGLALLGVVLAVGLVTNAGFFSDAVERAILEQKLAEFSAITGRPPFSTGVYVYPSTREPMSLQEAEELAHYVADTLSARVGLPQRHVGVQVSSGGMMLQPGEDSGLYGEGQTFLNSVDLVYKANVEAYIETVEGEALDKGASGETLDVWMHRRLAEKIGVHVGDEFRVGVSTIGASVPLHVRGFWQALDPTEPYWFNNPDETLKDALLVRRQDYVDWVQPLLPAQTRQVNWHVILDESRVNPARARDYITGFQQGLSMINRHLPSARLNAPPLDPLQEFVQRETTLTTLLLSFNLPAFGFLLYFLILTSAIIARWQRRDAATLVSRGMSVASILGLTLIEEFLLFIVGLPLGVGLGMLLARLMGYTASFLSFVSRPAMPVSAQGINWPLALFALAIALLARLWPTARAARQSMVELQREQARSLQAPVWQRYFLDFLLLAPTLYAYSQLSQVGALALLVEERPEDLYRDPLLILMPMLFILTMALMLLRVFPLLMRVVDRLSGALPWITLHLALRQLGRQSKGYINPLLLIIISLALGVYTLSMADSLDQWLVDRFYYRVGADMAFDPPPLMAPVGGGEGGGAGGASDGSWMPLPYKFRELPGVLAASRVGDYAAQINVAGEGTIHARFLAIDRLDFPTVAWFRQDFGRESLGAMMNRLALVPGGVLVSEQFLSENPFLVGEQLLSLRVSVNPELTTVSRFTVVGTYTYFPTVYEEDRVTFIGNMEYLSTLLGASLPHSMWLSVQEGADAQGILQATYRMGVQDLLQQTDTRELIAEEKAKTERIGILGTLTVGFLASSGMAALGLLIYTYASLREHIYRFAVLRALGLNRLQVVAQVILEFALLTVCGAAAGAVIGVTAAELFVPFFRVTGEQGIPLPPLLPIISQQDIALLVMTFAGVMVLLEALIISKTLSWHELGILRER